MEVKEVGTFLEDNQALREFLPSILNERFSGLLLERKGIDFLPNYHLYDDPVTVWDMNTRLLIDKYFAPLEIEDARVYVIWRKAKDAPLYIELKGGVAKAQDNSIELRTN